MLKNRDSDVGWTVPVSRSLYRPLLEAGVRIFEWNGTMVHAKTAVADSRWARIGSTNLNINSWMGNWELDVAVEDATVARTLEEHFEADLARSTEVVLKEPRRRPSSAAGRPARRYRSGRRAVRTVTGVGRTLGAAVTGNRPLENYEVVPIIAVALVLSTVAGIGLFVPWLLAWPVGFLAIWLALSLFAEAWQVWRRPGS